MSLYGHLHEITGRWFDALHPARTEAFTFDAVVTKADAPAVRTMSALESVDDGTGMWLAAGLVELHDEVNASGDWHTVTGIDVTRPRDGRAPYVVLYFAGRSVPIDYTALVYTRDAATIIGAQIRGAR